MVSLLKVDRVKYECTCGDFFSLARMFYCRHCSANRCPSCALVELDSFFCPNCLEGVPVGEARVKRNQCFACNQCPNCARTLFARTCVDSGGTYLLCGTCRWSTRDAGIEDQQSVTNWPRVENPIEGELAKVLEQLRNYEIAEKAQRDQAKFKRRSNAFDGSKFSDRFGLQAMYQKRKQAIEKPKQVVGPHIATSEVPPLDPTIFTQEAPISPSLDSLIMQPLAGDRPLGPVRIQLKARKATRCRGCDHHLAKFDYSPAAFKLKIQYFARNYVPEVRLSREAELIPGQTSSIFLTIYNHSEAKSDVVIISDPQDDCVECLTPTVDFTLPFLDGTEDVFSADEQTNVGEQGNEFIVFRKRNRVGIRLDVCAKESRPDNTLSLIVKYKNELSVMGKEKPVEWMITKVRVSLGPC